MIGRLSMSDLATALALVLVLEGVLWAISPQGMKRAAILALSLEDTQLRNGGLVVAAVGVLIIWLLRS